MKFVLLFASGASASTLINRCMVDGDVSFTFDDAPREYTEDILDVLKKENVSATFFVNGYRAVVDDYAMWCTLQRIHLDGHTIGTHTYSHPALVKLRDFSVYREFYDNEMIIRKITGKRPKLFRPPYFSYSDRILKIADHFSYVTLIGNLDTRDWESRDYNSILESFQNFTGKSFISVQHDGIKESAWALEKIIEGIRERFNIVSMEKCIGMPVYQEDVIYGPLLL